MAWGDKLASTRKASKTEPAHRALVRDREREERSRSLAERLQPVLDEIAAAPKAGREADKAFYDDLSGDR
ncbi:type II toxin-antitoxin system VapB family antitoxin [Methylobacterium radiodurans]|uniref:type II toxin-antitoxin system VapB family antitoxin n=1 Tax=Methylobacterium radiodurans TaxID=2202828 RepID=UPI001FEC6F71|nr:type II toxin-antitoxin system VapB family antitoxin [Methylobacterium radiodurans]